MTARQRFGHLVADELTVEQNASFLGGLNAEGASLWSNLDDGAKVFYCDPANGSSGNVGSRTAPVDTMAGALALCTSGRNDVIIRFPGGEEVDETCTFDVAGVTVIACTAGLAPGAKGEYFSMYAASGFTDGPVVTITERCTISGMAFISRDAGTLYYAGAAMLIGEGGASPFGVHIHRCRFPKWNLTNRIGIGVDGSANTLIEECSFEGVGADFASGIYVQGGGCQNFEVRNCTFRDCTYAITHGSFGDGGGPHCIYKGNVCEDAKMLDSGSHTATGLICDNWMELATGVASFNENFAGLASRGLYVSGMHYVEAD